MADAVAWSMVCMSLCRGLQFLQFLQFVPLVPLVSATVSATSLVGSTAATSLRYWPLQFGNCGFWTTSSAHSQEVDLKLTSIRDTFAGLYIFTRFDSYLHFNTSCACVYLDTKMAGNILERNASPYINASQA